MNGTDIVSLLLTLSNRFVPFGLTIILQTTVIIAAGLAVRKFTRKRTAAFQSAVLRATLIIVLMSPVVTIFFMHFGLYRFNVPLPNLSDTIHQQYQPAQQISDETPSAPVQQSYKKNSETINTPQLPQKKVAGKNTLQLQTSTNKNAIRSQTDISKKTPASPNAKPAEGILPQESSKNSGFIRIYPEFLLKIFVILFTVFWILASLYFLCKSIIITLCIIYIRNTASVARQKYVTACDESAQLLGLTAPPVLQHPVVRGTFVCGFIRPAIVLPYGDEEEYMATREVMLHELAHLARFDNFWNMISQIVLIVLPVQPLVSTLIKKISEVNDFACDDYVLTYGGNSKAYATQIFNISKSYTPGIPEAAIGSGIISNSSPLYDRIERILDTTYIRIIKVRAFEIFSVIVFSFSSISVTGFVGFNGNHTNGNGKRKYNHIDEQHIERVITHVPEDKLYQITSIGDNETASEKLTRKNESVRPETKQKTGKTAAEKSNDYKTISAGVSNADVVNNSLSADSSPATKFKETSGLAENIKRKNLQQRNEPVMASGIVQELPEQKSDTQQEKDTIEKSESGEGLKEDEDVTENVDELHTPEITVDIAQVYSNTMSSSALSNENNSNTVLKVIDVVITYDFENADISDPDEKKRYDMYRSLENNKLYPVWSPDGSRIVITDKSYGIWMVPVHGGEPELIYSNEPVQYYDMTIRLTGIEPLCFAPGGHELTFKRYIIDEDMGTEVIVDDSTTPASVTIMNPVPVIETLDIETGRTQVLAKGAAYGRWSSDGRLFVYSRLDANSFKELMIRDVLTGYEYSIDEFQIQNIELSPNDQYLMFNEDDVFMIPGTGELQRFTVGGDITFSDISRDGRWILYTYQNSLYVYDTHKEEATALYSNQNITPSWARFSPDLSNICFSLKNSDKNWQIYLYDFENITGTTSTKEETIPQEFGLKKNFPNPFNMATTIQFYLPEHQRTSMVIYNIMGQRIRELVSGELDPGMHSIVWDSRDDNGNTVGTGTYITQLIAGSQKAVVKMTLVK